MSGKEKKDVYVPVGERELNEVDKLKMRIRGIRGRIGKIQEVCDHDFRLVKRPELRESLVKGVFVGELRRASRQVEPSDLGMTLLCLKCSREESRRIDRTCPKCLHSMESKGCQGGERKKYFGDKYHYFAPALFQCPNCSFAVASDEWNQ